MQMAPLRPFRKTAILLGLTLTAAIAEPEPDYAARALEVTEYIQANLYNKKTGLYAMATDKPDPDFIWGGGVMFSALVGAAKHDKAWERDMRKNFDALESYWDDKVEIPGYEPGRTSGNGNDKYYDDNAWMVITFAEAYELTEERRYLKRSSETLHFVLSGWDAELDGGIWWHQNHKGGGKNTCANAPAALGCTIVARNDPKNAPSLVGQAERIVKWTNTRLQAKNGLFGDSINAKTRKVNPDQLTYNAGLMLRANLGMFRLTKDGAYLAEAIRIGKAAASLLDSRTGAYRDPVKWSHLMTEADLELHAATGEAYLLERSATNAAVHYKQFKENTPKDLLTLASIARELWLMAGATSGKR